MRKYFLLSAVALLTATNVNAASNESANVQVIGNIVATSFFSCSELNFGNIYLRADDNTGYFGAGTADTEGYTTGSVANITDYNPALCNGIDADLTNDYTLIAPETIELSGVESDVDGFAYLSSIRLFENKLHGTLNIPAGLSEGGEISGSFSIVIIQ
ncbi:MAG: hypothetical protein E7016_03405 [Alphaproteobacteria bacterium]|nr:hypothetical protein [Alphaproteobacteria bacterium]